MSQFFVNGSGGGGGGVATVTAGSNINLTGTATNPIVNLDTQILEPDGSAAAPSYSFSDHPDTGMYHDIAFGGNTLSFSVGGSEVFHFDGFNLVSTIVNNTFNGGVNLQSYFCVKYTNPSSYPYTVIEGTSNNTDDYYISVDSSTGAHTILLPNSPRIGITYVIKDRTGNATINNITVTTVGGTVLIDQSTTFVMNISSDAIQLIWNGTSYEIFSRA